MVTHNRPAFAAIADPTRRAILDALRHRERSAGDLAGLFPVSRPAVSRHLRVLRGAGLVRERRVAQSRLYSLDPTPLREVEQWIAHYRGFWAARLHNLKSLVESTERPFPPPKADS
ncbi:MAG: metalloregulator ArsR/SmtB family transcription factor [Gemmatimonadales bacterium]